jgi:hypothetical protein
VVASAGRAAVVRLDESTQGIVTEGLAVGRRAFSAGGSSPTDRSGGPPETNLHTASLGMPLSINVTRLA